MSSALQQFLKMNFFTQLLWSYEFFSRLKQSLAVNGFQGREFVKQYYNLLNEAPLHLHR